MTYRIARRKAPCHVFCITGTTFGTIVAPFSFGVYGLYFVSPLTALIGIIGLPLVLIHGCPGFGIAVYLGLVPKGEVISGIGSHTIIMIINAIVWAACYGLLGCGIDYLRGRKKKRGKHLSSSCEMAQEQ
jgi:hypothetical protein